jgi:hypothetical protein
MNFFKFFIFQISLLFSFTASAGYRVIGTVYAEDCYNFGISICSKKRVTEVRKNGQRFEIAEYFENVSEYSASKQMCWINTKSRNLGIISFGINAVSQPEFWGYDKENKYVKIDADNIYFKCIKQ